MSICVPVLNAINSSGTMQYPMYIGFMEASSILSVATVPSFSPATGHEVIASNVLSSPIKDWQRPVIAEKVDAIKLLYSNNGELMPNPVLLCQNTNTFNLPQIKLTPQIIGGMTAAALCLDIGIPTTSQEKPLWIIDGQHRINGLASSAQSSNKVPVVFLLNLDRTYYPGPVLAKIFAQVTTQATQLDQVHNEWLTFAFRLKKYSSTKPKSQEHWQAMEAVAKLCSTPMYGGINNEFHGQIGFNPRKSSLTVRPGGFSYDCVVLEDLIFEHYYNQICSAPRLTPAVLAEQLCLAHDSLVRVIPAAKHGSSVFFGSSSKQQSIMQDAFFAGVMTHLLKFGGHISAGWDTELRNLSFDTANWDFSIWCKSLSGQDATVSRNIAISFMKKSFEKNLLVMPGSIENSFQGNAACVELEACPITPTGRPAKTGRISAKIFSGGVTSTTLPQPHIIKMSSQTPNIGRVKFIDANSSGARGELKLNGKGLDLNHQISPLKVIVVMEFYGGTEGTGEHTFQW